MSLLILFIVTIVSFWLSAVAGGGASLILIPVLNGMLAPSQVPISLTIGTFTSNASRIAVFRKNINWKIFKWFVPFSIPAVLLGGYVIKYANPSYLEILIGIFLLANIPQLFKKKSEENQSTNTPPNNAKLAVIGFLAGFISGLTGAVGLLFNRFYLKYGLKKEEIIATRAANEIFLHFIKLIIYFSLGLYSKNAILYGVAIAIASLVSSYSVKYILPHISEHLFRKIGYAAMTLSGIVLLFSSFKKLDIQSQYASEIVAGKTVQEWSVKGNNYSFEVNSMGKVQLENVILPKSLPPHLQSKFTQYSQEFGQVIIEKVMQIGAKPLYEFNCYIDNKLVKCNTHE